MKILNPEILPVAKVCVVVNSVESRDMSKISNPLINAGVKLTEILFVGLFNTPVKSFGVSELRKAVSELEELLKVASINIVVDCTHKVDKESFVQGLIFKDIFYRDHTLWKSRGVLLAKLGDISCKFVCGLRAESIAREKDSREIIDSEFIVKPENVEIVIPKTVDEAKQAFNELAKAKYLAFDTEASGLKPFAKDFLLYTLQFTSNKDKNKSYIFFYEHPKRPVSNEFKEIIKKGTTWLLQNEKKDIWVHNFSYDGMVCKAKFDIDFYKVNIYDSMIIFHMLTNSHETVSLGLKDICFQQGVLFDWDNDLDKFKEEICKEMKIKKDDFKYEYFELDDLIQYAGYDTVALMYLIDKLYEMSANHPAIDVITETWKKHWQSIMQSLYYTMYNGLPFDMEGAIKLKEQNETKIAEIDELIADNSFIRNVERILQENALAKAWNEYNKKVSEAEEKGKIFKGKEPNLENGKYGSIDLSPKFKTTSNEHKKILFIDVLKMKVLDKTETGSPKLNDEVISKYVQERPDIDILVLFSKKAKLQKTLNTYVLPWIELVNNDRDGRLRSTFNPLNTSGRLRCSSPNILNISKKGGLKEIIKADYKNGYVIGQIDVNSLEAVSAILMHQDPYQIELIKELGELDPHSGFSILRSKISGDGLLDNFNAKKIEDLKYVKANFKDHRQASKGGVFSIQFLGSHRSLMHTYGLPEDKAKKLWDGHWELNKGEMDFIKMKIKKFSKDGYDIVHGNFPILTPDITENMDDKDNMNKIRPCYNAVHQSSAFAVLRALDKATRRFQKEGVPCKLILSVYDSIIYEGHIDHIAYASNVLYEYMSEPFIPNQLFPLSHEVEIGLDYSAEFVLSRDKDEQVKQLEEFKEKYNMKG